MSKASDQIRSLLFKPVPGGFVYRAPNPMIFGHGAHYLVSQAQQDAIVSTLTPRRPWLILAVWSAVFWLALSAIVVSIFLFTPSYSTTSTVILTWAMAALAILVLHVSARRKLSRVQPILAGAPLTDQRITSAEMRQALNKPLSHRRLLIAGLAFAVASVASGVAVFFLRNENVSLFSDVQSLLYSFNAVMLGLASASNFNVAARKSKQAEGTASGPSPRFTKVALFVAFTCGVALLGLLGASAWTGIKREFGDRAEGLRYESKGDRDHAIASFTKSIEADPDSTAAYMDRARVYSAKGEQDRAIADYTSVVEIEPRNVAAYRARAAAYGTKGDNDRAIGDYSKAIEIDPTHANTYFFRGNIYAAKKDNDRAIADFTKAIELNPQDAYSHFLRGLRFEAKAEPARAIADYTRAIAINPKYFNAHYFRGAALQAKGDQAGAMADYRAVIDLPAATPGERQRQGLARERLDRLAATPTPPVGPTTGGPGR